MSITKTRLVVYCFYACTECGVEYGMTEDFSANRLRDRRGFYCLNGHTQHYQGKSDAVKLAETQAEKLRLESVVEFERKRRRTAETTTKRERTRRKNVEKRVANGVCAWCHRHFVDLDRHVHTKHPEHV
jgi:hypothetical protein